MKQIKIGNRVVIIPGTLLASETGDFREPVAQRPKARRIVVIRKGKLVGRKRGQ